MAHNVSRHIHPERPLGEPHNTTDTLPAGTVTFLLTDIEGSTRAWEATPSAMREALLRHDALLNEGIPGHGGHVLTERGEGDSFFAVFARASDAVATACALQLAIKHEPWPEGAPVKVRMAVHTGEAGGDYRGPDVNRCARIRAIAHGGQVLLSAPTASLVRAHLPEGASLNDLGQHRLRDLRQPERIFQLNHEDLPSDFPRVKSLDAFRHNLPNQLTSFVGRDRELAEVKALLNDHHLVTLTAAGGAGKTRLALQVAADLVEGFPDGVWLVDLAPLAEGGLVPRAVAAPLDVRAEPGRPLAQTLIDHLRDKDLLIVLDNCEHLIQATSELVDDLLRAVPGLRILATSREALNIPGEATWRVPSLSLPDLTHLPPPDGLGRYEAVQLFVDRAVSAQPSFSLSEQNSAAVARVCHRLDGVPLALELAASRVKMLPPSEILRRLDDRFRLLTGGSRTALPRQQTLRAAVDWSHDLLSSAEQALFRRLSVFTGGFDLEAVEEVCRGEMLAGEDILDLLAQLVDKSLVVADPLEDGRIRYGLHETLRQYGQEKLIAAGEADDAHGGHLRYFLILAEEASSRAGRLDPNPPWLQRQEREHDNFRAALDWAGAHDPEAQLRLAGALAWFWYLHSTHMSEGRERLAEALVQRGGRTPIVARALWGASLLACWQGDTEGARPMAEESLSMWRELGDDQGEADALEAIGWTYFFAGDDQFAIRYIEESLDVARKLDNPRHLNRTMVAVCQVLVSMGRIGEAEPMAQSGLAKGIELEEPRDVHYFHHFLADCALARGDWVEAEARYGRSLRAALAYGNMAEAGIELQGVAMGIAGQGRAVKAFRLNGAATDKLDEVGMDLSGIQFWTDYQTSSLGPARQALGEAAVATAEEEGRQMGFDAAVDYALDRDTD
jgi:predicted ATPase/class 3 adenylate cyclase